MDYINMQNGIVNGIVSYRLSGMVNHVEKKINPYKLSWNLHD